MFIMTDRVPNFRLWAKLAANKRATSDEAVTAAHSERSYEDLKEPTLPKFHLAWEQHPHNTGSAAEHKVPHKSNHNPEPAAPKFHKWF